MDADIACIWLLALVRNKSNNKVVNGSQLSVLHCHVMSLIFSSPVGSLCHTRGVVRRPSCVVCVHHNYQK